MGLVSVSFLLVGLALCLLSLLPMLLSNIRAHLGIWLPLALGIAMVLFGRFYRVVFQQASDAVGWAGFGLLCIFVLWLAVSLLVLALGYPRFTQKEPLCTVVVPGCSVLGVRPSKMLLRRLETACKVLEENPDYSCIVTGGQGRGEDCTEAKAMKDWFVAQGLDPGRIYLEDRSTNTWENLSFAKDILKENHLPQRVLVVSDRYHLFRCSRILEKLGLSCACLPCPINPVVAFGYWFRECVALPFRLQRKGRKHP